MKVIMNHELKRIKSGWSARTDFLGVGLAAHGYSQEVAQANLERTIRLFLAPFKRSGMLENELQHLGLSKATDGQELKQGELLISLE